MIEYPHTTRRHVLVDPLIAAKALDVSIKPNLTVGYVMGVGDEVPAALEQLGVKLSMITPDELAWGDLSHYNVIMTGVRAYERRADLRANNQRLLDYAKAGGTVIVQDNKFEFNDAQDGRIRRRSERERVTDENAEMKLLDPQHPVFNGPNKIARADWANWVRSAASISSTKRTEIRNTRIRSSSPSRSLITRAPSAERSSKPRSDRAAGSTSASDCGASCPRARTVHIG